ncbi:MAG: type IV secretion system protein [Rickettsiaceae bacterium H1]|nr:type IV secretion system protein [Rickettsiaceae bacterium H1]
MIKFIFYFILFVPYGILAKCINASDITQEDVVDVVYANSSKNTQPESGCSKNWVKSQVPLKDVQRVVEIVDKEVNLCAKSENSNEAESIEVNVIAIHGPISAIPLNFRQHDSVKFSSLPAVSGKITAQICENTDPNVKVFDVQKCKSDFVGKSYTSIISNDIDGENSNLVNYNNVLMSNWINSPLYVIDPLDDNDKTVISKTIEALTGFFSSNKDLWQAVCDYNSASNQDDQLKINIEKIRNGMTSYELNKTCDNICHVQYDNQGNKSATINDNCLFSVSSERVGNNQYSSYLPGLVVREGSDSGRMLGASGELSPRGVELNKEYELTSANPKVWVDITQGLNGGYKLLVTRRCTYHNKRSLYYYVGDSCPTINPGDAGTNPIEMIENVSYVNRRFFTLDSAWDGKSIYYGVKDNGDGENNNSGHFELTTRVPKEIKTPFANVVDWVITHVNHLLYGDNTPVNPGAVGRVYRTFINGPFVSIIQSILILYIAVCSLLYIMGMIRSSQMEVIVILVKIGIVVIVISPNSWEFFNEYLFKVFTEGSIDLINVMSSHSDADTKFKFIDRSLSRFAESETWVQIFSLIFTGPLGFIIAFAIIWGIWMLFLAILRAIIIFITSVIIIALLLSIAPFFISFVLFKRTKTVFDNWIKILASTAFQPIMIFATIAMLNNVIMGITYALFNYDVCTQCVANVSINDQVKAFCLLNTYLPRTYVATSTYKDLMEETYDGFSFFGVPILLPSLIAFVILTHTLSFFVQKVPSIISDIFNVISTEINHPAQAFEDSMRAVVGKDAQSMQRRAANEHTKKLHDNPRENLDKRDEARRREGINK